MAPIINPQFCQSYPVDLNIVKKIMNGNLEVTDINGNMMFKVERKLGFRLKIILVDATGIPIATIGSKIQVMSAHSQWEVFKGDSTNSEDLSFSTKRTSFLGNTKVEVFLANNITENVCDYKVLGSWLQKNCVVYVGESSEIAAQIHKKHRYESVLLGNQKLMVKVSPNIDYAFILAFIAILDNQ